MLGVASGSGGSKQNIHSKPKGGEWGASNRFSLENRSKWLSHLLDDIPQYKCISKQGKTDYHQDRTNIPYFTQSQDSIEVSEKRLYFPESQGMWVLEFYLCLKGIGNFRGLKILEVFGTQIVETYSKSPKKNGILVFL